MPLDELNNSPSPTTDWPAIDRTLLGEPRAAPVSFPLPLLPGRWRDWVEAASRSAERPAWLAGWDAAPARIRGAEQACFAVGLMGALSPERLAPAHLSQGFIDGDSALAARFLYVWPEPAGLASLGDAATDDE